MLKSILSWFSTFDAARAIFILIITVVSSWYDLKTEVQLQKSALTSYVKESTIRLDSLTTQEKETRDEVKQLTRDIKDDIREIRKAITK